MVTLQRLLRHPSIVSHGVVTRGPPLFWQATGRHVQYRCLQPRSTNFRRDASSTAAAPLRKTGLYKLHVENGGKMVPFAGFSMPVQYDDLTLAESHRWTREKASLFDVGHMVQHRFSGPAAVDLLELITPASLGNLKPLHSTLACLLHPETGGIVDDTVIAALSHEDFYVVTNAACREKDIKYISEQISGLKSSHGNPKWEVLKGQGLLALQGPLSAEILQNVLANPEDVDLKAFYFGQCRQVRLKLPSGALSPPVLVSRGGYTGEDGFEISTTDDIVIDVAYTLLRSAGSERLRLAGLGARDSLRLEAGMCLYGHDLDDKTTPVEAGLSWIVPKDRRTTGNFHGSNIILKQLQPKEHGGGISRRRVGMVIEGAPAREGAQILGPDGEVVGNITSGSPSPTLGKNIAMGYVRNGLHKVGTKLDVSVRGRKRKGEIVRMPFVPNRYWKQASGTAPT